MPIISYVESSKAVGNSLEGYWLCVINLYLSSWEGVDKNEGHACVFNCPGTFGQMVIMSKLHRDQAQCWNELGTLVKTKLSLIWAQYVKN